MVNSLGLRLSAGSSKTIPITVPISENVPFCLGFVTRGITVVQKECLRPRNPIVGNPFSELPPRCETKSIMIKARAVGQTIYCFQCSFPMSHPEIEKENPPSLGSSYSDPTHVDLFSDETVDPVYQAKAHVLNQAIQEITSPTKRRIRSYIVLAPQKNCRMGFLRGAQETLIPSLIRS